MTFFHRAARFCLRRLTAIALTLLAALPAPWALAVAGVTVMDVRYRLAPEHRFPAAIADVKCLLGRLREHYAAETA